MMQNMFKDLREDFNNEISSISENIDLMRSDLDTLSVITKDIKGELASLRHDQTNLKQKIILIENKHDNLQRGVLEIQNALDFNCDMSDKLGQRVERLETDCVKTLKPLKSYLILSRRLKLWSSMLGAVTLRYVVSQKKGMKT
ncbi:unnamed protein product [Parnassius apollo]|uniref:(apollo) hypothetical protein n=1 Tax=Parnassius apollo TaxID=110799 RepID=A0A8S3XYT9_PARAO|nr:unnamed protein product [Parnassius apollo]